VGVESLIEMSVAGCLGQLLEQRIFADRKKVGQDIIDMVASVGSGNYTLKKPLQQD